jgi:hypothetical protein
MTGKGAGQREHIYTAACGSKSRRRASGRCAASTPTHWRRLSERAFLLVALRAEPGNAVAACSVEWSLIHVLPDTYESSRELERERAINLLTCQRCWTLRYCSRWQTTDARRLPSPTRMWSSFALPRLRLHHPTAPSSLATQIFPPTRRPRPLLGQRRSSPLRLRCPRCLPSAASSVGRACGPLCST